MERTQRDTGSWFNNDNKGHIKDKRYIKAMAPGVYNPANQPLGDKSKKISWNFGAVPFGTCNERFRSEMRAMPGPGSYAHDKMQLTKPIPVKGTTSSPRMNPQNANMSRTFHTAPLIQASSGGMLSVEASAATITRK